MLNLRKDINFSMPCGVIQHLPFPEQVETMKRLGFQEFTLHPFYLGVYTTQGLTLQDMKAMVDDNGLRIGRIDPLTTWVPDWQAYNFGHDYMVQNAMDATELLDLSAFFDCKYTSLNAMWKAGRYTEEEIVGFYRDICGRAEKYGMSVDIEPIPMWGIPRLEDALSIIDKAAVPNGGLVIDTTHLVRGGTSLAAIERTPADLVHLVQLCDGVMPATMSLEDECFNRMWPGTGQFPVGEIVRILDRIGALRGVGPEVFSPNYARENTPGSWIVERTEQALANYPELLGG